MKKLTSFLVALVFAITAYADDPDLSLIPKFFGTTGYGNEFWITIPPCFTDESAGWNNFVKIFVTSPITTPVVVEIPGRGYYSTKPVRANDVIEFNLSPVQAQPYSKTGPDPTPMEQIFPGAGIHIYSNDPIACYVVVRYKWTSDGFLAIPVASLGKEYIVAGWNVDPMFRSVWNYKLPNVAGVVAAFDDTKVSFILGGNPNTKTAGGMKPGDSVEFTLRAGDVWMVGTDVNDGDLSGSLIRASKPVGVVSGNQCTNIPTGNQWCDYTVEMDLPTFIWGKHYIVPKVPYRKYPSIIRVFAKEPNTTIYKNGNYLGTLVSGGGNEGKAFFTLRISEFVNPPTPVKSCIITADKPIGVTLYNTGVQEDGAPAVQVSSDPFVMAISPVEQFQNEISFCTPGIAGALGFPENFLNVVAQADTNGNFPSDIEFANVIGGQFKFESLIKKFPTASESIKSPIDDKTYLIKTITLPGDGVYRIKSANNVFGAYSFGYSDYDSYGYPTAARMSDLEKNDSAKPILVFNASDFSSVGSVTGTVTDKPDNIKNRSNLSSIILHNNLSTNCELKYSKFIPGESSSTTWQVTTNDLQKPSVAVLSFYDRHGNDTTIVMKYDPMSSYLQIKLLSPVWQGKELPVNIKFIWAKSGFTTYRIQICDNINFDAPNSFDVMDTFKVISGLKYNTEYYWRVQGLKDDPSKQVISTSQIWYFKTAPAVPNIVKLVSPTDDAQGLNCYVNLSWEYNYSPYPDSFSVQIALDKAFSNIVNTVTGIIKPNTTIKLNKNQEYYWRVNAQNMNGTSPWSAPWQFNITTDAVSLQQPADKSIEQPSKGKFIWADFPGSQYHLQVFNENDTLNPMIDKVNIYNTSEIYNLEKNNKYFWRVRATDSVLHDWSPLWSFEIVPNPPVEFSLISPPDNTTEIDKYPTLKWNNAGKNIEYTVRVAKDQSLSKDINRYVTTNESLIVPVEPNTRYYWNVTADNYSGIFISKDIWSFTTGSVMDVEEYANTDGINISPNPASTFIEITLLDSKDLLPKNIMIYDIFGKKFNFNPILSTNENKIKIDIAGLAPGVYFVRIGDTVQKFIKM